MKINGLRKELNCLILAEDCRRKPAVRRSRQEEWIYVTDLPECASGERLESIRRKLEEAGWESLEEDGWMQLRKTVEEPPEGWYDGPFGPEAGCCGSLLRRHPECCEETDRRITYALIRAGEEGAEAYEAVCRRLHRDWAIRLRKGEKLPNISRLYFEGGK